MQTTAVTQLREITEKLTIEAIGQHNLQKLWALAKIANALKTLPTSQFGKNA